MFSSMTMASSTTKPVAMVSAISVRLLMVKPARYITAKVPISDSGTTTEGMMVADSLRRNRKVTITTRADRKSTRLNSSHVKISYAVFCLKKKNIRTQRKVI